MISLVLEEDEKHFDDTEGVTASLCSLIANKNY